MGLFTLEWWIIAISFKVEEISDFEWTFHDHLTVHAGRCCDFLGAMKEVVGAMFYCILLLVFPATMINSAFAC